MLTNRRAGELASVQKRRKIIIVVDRFADVTKEQQIELQALASSPPSSLLLLLLPLLVLP